MSPRTDSELELMRRSGRISASALKKALEKCQVGVSLLEIEQAAREEIERLGGSPSFMSVAGYQWATCLTVNDEVVHGIPRDIILKEGDKISIDVGTIYKGWHTDCAWSVIVSHPGVSETSERIQTKGSLGPTGLQNDKQKFLRVGEEALWKGISQAREGNHIDDISKAIEETIEGAGYKVVHSLVGHGVGKELHEEPEVPGFRTGQSGIPLKQGMTLAIEAIYTESTHEVQEDEDGWTIRSLDGSMGGLFEMSVIVGRENGEVLTDWRKI